MFQISRIVVDKFVVTKWFLHQEEVEEDRRRTGRNEASKGFEKKAFLFLLLLSFATYFIEWKLDAVAVVVVVVES